MRTYKYKGHESIPANKRDAYKVAIRRGYMETPYDLWRTSFIGYYLSNPACLKCIKQLDIVRNILGGEIPTFSNLTDSILYQIKDYYTDKVSDDELSVNSAAMYAGYIRIALSKGRIAGEELSSKNFQTILQIKAEPTQDVYLTMEQLYKIDKYKPKNNDERIVKNLIMREALCGARTSECLKLNKDNIQGDNLVYYAEKNKSNVIVPCHKLLKKYLKEKIGEVEQTKVNPILRQIGKECGLIEPVTLHRAGKTETKPMYEWLHTHCLRKSFASILYLLGVEVREISRLIGHKSIQTTERYIIPYKEVGKRAMKFFNG